ncbi:SHQ1-domain-containing protein [Vararia minispora EC-137]|uniref:SHQ1-domain-containing protein n=1 Tax=Vararia minispora EC-137 TaxID=1314806 RepID=A0ACB8QVP4_9AGAM|nr:SHQ1-domain-containing protein [Vararia minispora EC-137]
MITPRFSCSQTDACVVTSIYCPSVRASEIEIHVDDTLLSVHIAPYFLRLNFPGNVVEDDASSAVYDPTTGYLTITLNKVVPGLEFPDLDLLAKLLAPRRLENSAPRGPLVEILSSEEIPETAEEEIVTKTEGLSLDSGQATQEWHEILEAAQNDWQIPQTVPEMAPKPHTLLPKPYGFFDAYTGYFVHVANTENEVNELGSEAENVSPGERRRRRLEQEDAKWDAEHYMADYVDHDVIDELLWWKHPSLRSLDVLPFSEAENLTMLQLPRKEYLPTPSQTRSAYLTLLTILFAYAYDARFTQHDPTPESAWTICVLIPAFSALDSPPYMLPSNAVPVARLLPSQSHQSSSYDIASTLAASYRRSLAYPLYRSWALSESCRSDVASFLIRGTRAVLRCLLEVRALLDAHEVYYVYSRIWLDDFCSWIQSHANDDSLKTLAEAVRNTRMEKAMIGWDLEELEAAARAAAERSSDSDDSSEGEVEQMTPSVLQGLRAH